IWDESLKAYRMRADTLRLGQIDLAPADRAGIPDLAAVPHLTTEMQDSEEEDSTMPEKGKLDYINEMTADDARRLPPPVRQAILAEAPIAPEIALVQELRSQLQLDDK